MLRECLQTRGYRLEEIKGDGNCLFRSVAFHVSGGEEDYAYIRARAIQELRVSGWVGGWLGGCVGVWVGGSVGG